MRTSCVSWARIGSGGTGRGDARQGLSGGLQKAWNSGNVFYTIIDLGGSLCFLSSLPESGPASWWTIIFSRRSAVTYIIYTYNTQLRFIIDAWTHKLGTCRNITKHRYTSGMKALQHSTNIMPYTIHIQVMPVTDRPRRRHATKRHLSPHCQKCYYWFAASFYRMFTTVIHTLQRCRNKTYPCP